MRRQTYITPAIEEWHMTKEELLADSDLTNSDLGITFGGIDESGDKDPLSRPFDFIRDE